MTLKGMLAGLFVASEPDSLISRPVPVVRVLANGFEGDKHQGWFRQADVRAKRYPKRTLIWNSRQLSIVSEEELAMIADDLGIELIKPEWLGANMCVRGIQDFSLLKPRTKIFIPNENGLDPEVGFYITALNKPCIAPAKVIQEHCPEITGYEMEFVKAAVNRRGVVAVVEHGGIIRTNTVISAVVQD